MVSERLPVSGSRQPTQRSSTLAVNGAPPGRALAAAVGNRQMQRIAGVLQRYRETTLDPGRSRTPQFVTQPAKPEIEETVESPGRLPYDFRYPRRQHAAAGLPLLVSDDGTMAIHKTAAEPKEFYAHPAVIRRANEQLEDVDSSFRLELSGHQTIEIDGEELQRVRPLNVRIDQQYAERYEDLLQNICVRMAGEVMGSKGAYESEVVLRGAGSLRSFPIRPGPTKDPGIKALTHHLASEVRTSPESAAEAVHAQLGDQEIAESADVYGRQVARGYMDLKAQALGINEFIRPKVGEGLATFGNPGADPIRDYSIPVGETLEPTLRGETWGYHFAGVVAASFDGNDFVTLENYNRGVDMEHKLSELQTKVLTRYFSNLGAWWQGLSIEEADDETVIRDKFKLAAKQVTGEEGVKEYFRLQREAQPNTAWFFRMYGTRAGSGQTYHEREARSGEFVNALSVLVRKRDRWVGAVNEDLRAVPQRLSAADFDAGSRAAVEGHLAPLRANLIAALTFERSVAEQAVDERWERSRAGEARFECWITRHTLFSAAGAARQHLRGLERAGSPTDKAAAERVLAAFSTFSSPRPIA